MKHVSKWAILQASNEIRQWIKLLAAGGVIAAAYLEHHPDKKFEVQEWARKHGLK